MRKSLLALSALFLSLTSYAGNERGNGGDAVVCRDSKGNIRSAELLDFYEGKSLRGITPTIISSNNRLNFLKSTAAKLEQFDEGTFGNIKTEMLSLNKAITSFLHSPSQRIDNVVFTNDELTDIPDSGELSFKPGCKIEQLAIKVKKIYPQDPSYVIQADILNYLSETDITGLVLHETIYDSLVKSFQISNSTSARYLNQILSSNMTNNFYFWDYIQFRIASCNGNYNIKKAGKDFSTMTAKQMSDGSVLADPAWSSTHNYNLVFDKYGNFSSKLTLKWGSIKISPYYNILSGFNRYINWNGGLEILANNSNSYHWELPVSNQSPSSVKEMRYGQWHATFCFEPHDQEAFPLKVDIGFSSLNNITIFKGVSPASPLERTCFQRAISVNIDETLTLVID